MKHDIEHEEKTQPAIFETFPTVGNGYRFARLEYQGMVFEFPSSDEALNKAIRTPVDPEDEEFYVEGWPEHHVLERDTESGREKRQLDRQHVEQLLKDPKVFVIAADATSAQYIADLRGVEAPSDRIFSELTGQPIDAESKPDGCAQVRHELRTMLLYPHATDRLIDFLASRYGGIWQDQGHSEDAGRALTAVVEAVKTLVDPRIRASLYDGLNEDEAKQISSNENQLLEAKAEATLRDILKA